MMNAPCYFHGSLSRKDAESVLTNKPVGSFLLRKSLRDDSTYAISVVSSDKVLHYSIEKSPHTQLYSVLHGSEHESPILVCEHYIHESSGLKTKLLYPVSYHSTIDRSNYSSNSLPPSNLKTYEDFEWFHGLITRDEDSRRLSMAYNINQQNGMFLVRKKTEHTFVLSLVHLEKVHRYLINQDPTSNQFYLDEKEKSLRFSSLEGLLEYHKHYPPEITGLKCRLSSPCRRSSLSINGQHDGLKPQKSSSSKVATSVKQMASNLAAELRSILPANSLDVNWSETTNKYEDDSCPSLSHQSTLKRFNKKSMPKDSIGFYSPYRNIVAKPDDGAPILPDLYISKDKIDIMDTLGEGHFGSVRLAECSICGEKVPCAVKVLCGTDIQANRTELLKEATVMQHLDHPFIVRLLAVCDPGNGEDNNLMIVLELAPLGTLKDFIKRHNEESFPENKILMLMNQVCDGMAYLSNNNVVHRDLAARNVLLVSENFVKISDFGMSRILHDSSDYYRASKPGSWPLRWYPPEALLYYRFTSKGDVWSFGVTVWEVCSYGSRPYKGMRGRDILQMLECEKRLECPAGCSPGLYTLLLQCWAYDPESRPTFQQLLMYFENLMD